MQLNTNCPHCWKQLFHWFCSTMNLNATLVLPVLGEYLIFVDIHYWFQFFEHFRIREPPVPVLWGKIWTKELEYKHCNTSAEWVFDFANIRQFQFFKHFRTRELPVLVLWKTIQDQRTASSGSLENNSGSKNCQFWFFGKQFRIKELPVLVLWKTIQDQRTASSGSLENNSGLKNCQFWFFGKQFRIKELPVPVMSETSTNKWVSQKNC